MYRSALVLLLAATAGAAPVAAQETGRQQQGPQQAQRAAVVEGFDGPVSVGAAVTRAASGRSWSLLTLVGVTETAPDLTLGLSWSLRLSR